MKCDICKKERQCTLEPTRRQLIFSGFPVKLEKRCSRCEKNVSKSIQVKEILSNDQLRKS